nr:MAG TPA: hypothetical protein [Caudoviricetes sp.]
MITYQAIELSFKNKNRLKRKIKPYRKEQGHGTENNNSDLCNIGYAGTDR